MFINDDNDADDDQSISLAFNCRSIEVVLFTILYPISLFSLYTLSLVKR